MKITKFLITGLAFVLSTAVFAQNADYPIQPKPFTEVKINDNFWAPKIKTNHEVTIPIAIQKSLESGRVDNFKIAGGLMDGKFCSEYPFDDSDIYKIIEAASYSLQTYPDPELEKTVDSLIYFVNSAQEDDGYLFTNRTIGKNLHSWVGTSRWEKVNDLSHELYNLGHMFEAATAHYAATGKRTLLDVAIKAADRIDADFGPGKIQDYPGHQEVELGLVKLYRATNDEKYLNLAKYFLDIRGQKGIGNPTTYNQSHKPVTEQSEAVGHAVRATYMWIAMADVAALTGNKDYIEAIDRLWHDVVDTKMYVIGGIGATGNHEGFDEPYVLPNMSAYNETCAAVGNAFWNHRMFLMSGDSKYIDVMELSMYNNVISGVSVSGDHFFYPNPLASYGQHSRSEWFGCACCPPNVARFLPYMPGMIYAQDESDVYVNLFISSDASFKVGKKELALSQKAELPWEGTAEISVTSAKPVESNIKIRIPGWAKNQPVPSDLYTYADKSDETTKISVNGNAVEYKVDEKGYVNIERKWKKGDKISIEFPYEIREVKANEKITEDNGKVAIERGPIVYCTEWADYKDGHVLNLLFDPASKLTASIDPNFYGGVTVIEGEAKSTKKELDESITVSEDKPMKLIPYYLWNNRGPGEMRVWLPTEKSATKPLPAPTVASQSKATASVKSKAIMAIKDQYYPKSSNDSSNPYLHWWPKTGTLEWVEYEFEAPKEVFEVKVYWYDDAPFGGCRIPTSWEVVYKDGDEWKPVPTSEEYKVVKDDWNTIKFDPVKTSTIRVKLQLDEKFSAGIHELIVN